LFGYYYLAHVHDLLYSLGLDRTPERLAMAEAAVQRALHLRPDSGEAHLALAQHLDVGSGDYERARQELTIARIALPNESLVYLLLGSIDRRQSRWKEALHELEYAAQLDPRNIHILEQTYITYGALYRYNEAMKAFDDILTIAPNDRDTNLSRAYLEFEWHADTRPLHSLIESILMKDPKAAVSISSTWVFLALCERDQEAAASALNNLPADGCYYSSVPFPRAWCEGMVARERGDKAAARDAFTRALAETETKSHNQPPYAQQLCVLGMIDAALGNKESAIEHGRRAVELCPVTTNSLTGALLATYLAVIYAWSEEKQLAIEQLQSVTRLPGGPTYGELRLHPYWDPLRADPQFENIVAAAADRKPL